MRRLRSFGRREEVQISQGTAVGESGLYDIATSVERLKAARAAIDQSGEDVILVAYLALPFICAHWAILRRWAEPHYLASYGLMPARHGGSLEAQGLRGA